MVSRTLLFILLSCLEVATAFFHHYGRNPRARHGPQGNTATIKVGDMTCREAWFEQVLDHFSWRNDSRWQQRYYVCQETEQQPANPAATIFFYCGNEGNVEMYIRNTGLMFENAKSFSAMLIFAEHRYYGKSLPFGNDFSAASLRYLSHEQALADYAVLLDDFKRKYKMVRAKVITFGGSYGGMLSAWFRMKYPHIVEGAVAASAPVLSFHSSSKGPWRSEKYWEIVTRDASGAAGSDERCIPLVRQSWPIIDSMGASESGRESLDALFRLCEPLASPGEVKDLKLFIAMAFDTMAMGNYPFPSDYLTGGIGKLPPWPVREACKLLSSCGDCKAENLLDSLRSAISLLYNASGDQACLQLPQDSSYAGIWDFQWCTEMLPQETYFKRDGKRDMFFPFSISSKEIDQHCKSKYGVIPRRGWIEQLYGGLEVSSPSPFSLPSPLRFRPAHFFVSLPCRESRERPTSSSATASSTRGRLAASTSRR